MVEAIEELFVPALVYNNREGKNAKLLKQFNEPSWNNPVVRYLDFEGQDVIPRKAGVWTTQGTAKRMLAALKAANRDVPRYFEALLASQPSDSLETATFAMHCYWEGEAKLGSIEGVHSTRSGWKANLEVVTLKYDPKRVEYERLIDLAQSFECASKVFTHSEAQQAIAQRKVGEHAVVVNPGESVRDAKASDQKYYLLQTPIRHLPLVEFQATKINAALKSGQPFDRWLSPRQKTLLKRILVATEKDKNWLEGLQYPTKTSELAQYTSKLVTRLDELESK